MKRDFIYTNQDESNRELLKQENDDSLNVSSHQFININSQMDTINEENGNNEEIPQFLSPKTKLKPIVKLEQGPESERSICEVLFAESQSIENEINNKITEYITITQNIMTESNSGKIYNGNDVLSSHNMIKFQIVSNWLIDSSISNVDSFTINNKHANEDYIRIGSSEYCKECPHCNNNLVRVATKIRDLFSSDINVQERDSIIKKKVTFKNSVYESSKMLSKFSTRNLAKENLLEMEEEDEEEKVRKLKLLSQLQKNIESSNRNILDPSSFYKKWLYDIHSNKMEALDVETYQLENEKVNDRIEFLCNMINKKLFT
jgi:hypothetical protein